MEEKREKAHSQWESNSGPLDLKSDVLPLELPAQPQPSPSIGLALMSVLQNSKCLDYPVYPTLASRSIRVLADLSILLDSKYFYYSGLT